MKKLRALHRFFCVKSRDFVGGELIYKEKSGLGWVSGYWVKAYSFKQIRYWPIAYIKFMWSSLTACDGLKNIPAVKTWRDYK